MSTRLEERDIRMQPAKMDRDARICLRRFVPAPPWWVSGAGGLRGILKVLYKLRKLTRCAKMWIVVWSNGVVLLRDSFECPSLPWTIAGACMDEARKRWEKNLV